MSIFSKRRQCSHTVSFSCLVPRRLSFDENVRAKEGGKETTGETSPAVFALPMVPCGSSLVTCFALAIRKTKRLRRRRLEFQRVLMKYRLSSR